MKRILIFLVLGLSLPLYPADLPETVSKGLVLEARVDKTTFRVGEAIKVTVVMRNESDFPIMVAANFGQEIADPTPDNWNADPSSYPRDMLWNGVFYVTPFGTRYRQDHAFPRTLEYSVWNAPVCDQFFGENEFWYRNLIALLPGMEVGFVLDYEVRELPAELSEGNYKIQYRYSWSEELIQRQRRFLSRLASSTTLDPVPMLSSGMDSGHEYSALPYYSGTVFSNTLRLKVVKGDTHD